MRYFVDTEFHERGPKHPIELIGIAIVAEDGREFYAVNTSFDWSTASNWLRENVRPHLRNLGGGTIFAGLDWFPELIRDFIGNDPHPELWGYYCAFDYVVLSQLMGGFEQWPEGWPFLMRDLRVLLDDCGMHDVKQPDDAPHNALEDARWVQRTYRSLEGDV